MSKKLIKTTDLKGFVQGVHYPYTDYSKDIADWLLKNAVCSGSIKDTEQTFIFTDITGEFYAHNNYIFSSDIYYTNDEFKELIGMNKKLTSKEKLNEILINEGQRALDYLKERYVNNAFTKSDLKAGDKVTISGGGQCTLNDDLRVFVSEYGATLSCRDLNEDLTCTAFPFFNITKVERPVVMYERVDVYKQNITKELEFAKAKMLRLQSHIDVLESKIR